MDSRVPFVGAEVTKWSEPAQRASYSRRAGLIGFIFTGTPLLKYGRQSSTGIPSWQNRGRNCMDTSPWFLSPKIAKASTLGAVGTLDTQVGLCAGYR